MKLSEENNKMICDALMAEKNEDLEKVLNSYLETLVDLENEESFIKIRDYLLAADCVENVDISGDLKRSNPPIKEIIIQTRIGEKIHSYRLSLRVKNNEIRYSYCKQI